MLGTAHHHWMMCSGCRNYGPLCWAWESGAWLHGVYRMWAETAAVLGGTNKKNCHTQSLLTLWNAFVSTVAHTMWPPEYTSGESYNSNNNPIPSVSTVEPTILWPHPHSHTHTYTHTYTHTHARTHAHSHTQHFQAKKIWKERWSLVRDITNR